ncbi:PREDICTED: protein NLP1 [Camelina sativa]|uniref:Protein NLP1 n=1 Tax=Camelina sativa TaxID=90675 RepID=A0ABM0ZGV3_CAMSA|nr:PREDICTED: protein NLP1 [Camelina sativa]XP_010515539.1 PREDICTED: protein NLP1 [Camelina sativa]XP_010515548.1 PREDICTED: protein NLP1 [Camelina sativa]XP_010515562.1 PREDICTED: protein NLP1 [Camelina sativa]XP_019083798.1 PREDICTED: protein NLP1 [Camelina sativa]
MEDDGGGDGGEGNGGFSPNSSFGAFPDAAMDLDFMDELLFDGCWLQTTDSKNLNQAEQSGSASTAMNDNSTFLCFGENPSQDNEETENNESMNQESFNQAEKFLLEEAELGKGWWIAPRASEGPSSSVKERLLQAISGLNETVQDKDFLVQIWVPVQQEGKSFLTTWAQPHLFNQEYSSLAEYRHVSETYNFPADEGMNDYVGLPGRVFLQKLPEWTPDVRFFRRDEYPRIKEARKCDVRGSLALPVFERGSGICLGVVEIVTTTQKMNYRQELEKMCKALEAVDLRSSSNLNTPSSEFLQVYSDFYCAALPEIKDFLATVCRSYDLPLALSWAPCAPQGKRGSRHSDENFSQCVSTTDSACSVPDEQSKSFWEACSEHHLLQGEGIVGKAFKATKLFFVPEVTTFSKTNYPLAHHAKISGLHAALAVPLKSKSGLVEFVLEFFFPKACLNTEAQQEMLRSLSVTLQQDFRSSNLVIDKDLELEVVLPVRETMLFSENPVSGAETAETLTGIQMQESSWISHMIKANEKGKDVSLSWEYQKEDPKELSSGRENHQLDPSPNNVPLEAEQFQQASTSGLRVDSGPSTETPSTGGKNMLGSRRPGESRRSGEKRRTKTEKTIGLEVLRQHFAGSLKDAAKSIGVCPTTLKRICRQHGIMRWPSRKIKKVGHSLKKLQLVMDSVQGAQGTIQLDSFYTSFPELNSPNMSSNGPSLKSNEQSSHLNAQTENGIMAEENTAPRSPSSPCTKSSGSSNNNENTANILVSEDADAALNRAHSEVELHQVNQEETDCPGRTQSHKTLKEPRVLENSPSLPGSSNKSLRAGGAIKVKATFGEARIRFTLLPSCGFRELQQEIARRFNVDDVSWFDLKYLDDDKEWVLLTCEADLDECIDIYRLTQTQTIKISLNEASQVKLGGSFGSAGPS